jgi:hypothetical protein
MKKRLSDSPRDMLPAPQNMHHLFVRNRLMLRSGPTAPRLSPLPAHYIRTDEALRDVLMLDTEWLQHYQSMWAGAGTDNERASSYTDLKTIEQRIVDRILSAFLRREIPILGLRRSSDGWVEVQVPNFLFEHGPVGRYAFVNGAIDNDEVPIDDDKFADIYLCVKRDDWNASALRSGSQPDHKFKRTALHEACANWARTKHPDGRPPGVKWHDLSEECKQDLGLSRLDERTLRRALGFR